MPALSDNLGGRRDFTATNTGAGIPAASNNLQGRTDFTQERGFTPVPVAPVAPVVAPAPVTTTPAHLGGRRDFTQERGFTPVPAVAPAPVTTTPAHLGGRRDFTQERGFTPATPAATDLTTFDEGDQYPAAPTEAAILDWLGTEGAAILLGGGGDQGGGGGGGGGSAGGGATAEAPIYYSEGGISGYDLQTTLADIEAQMGRVDEQKLMQTSDLNRAMEQAQRALPGQFNRRGMLNSGLYNRAEGRLAEAGQRQRGRAEYGFGESYDALSRAAASAEGGASQAAIRNTMTDAERQASMASNIRDLGVY